jgi:Flp pilus assembly protein protease CpaA
VKTAGLAAPEGAAPGTGRTLLAAGIGAGIAVCGAVIVARREPPAGEAVFLTLTLAALALVAAIDIRSLRAPNVIVVPAVVAALSVAFARGSEAGFDALAGGLLVFAALLVVAVVGRGAMGMGDVKAGTIGGIAVGAGGVLPMLVAAFIFGGVVAAVVLLIGYRKRDDAIALTPFLAFGTLAALAWA